MTMPAQYIPTDRQRAVTANATYGATDAQRAFIAKLEAEGRTTAVAFDGSKKSASAYITALLAAPRPARMVIATVTPDAAPAAPVATEAGMYRKDGEIFRVKISEAGRAYATVLVGFNGARLRDCDATIVNFKFDYAPGAIYSLTAADKLSLADAKAFGIRTGTCCVCARKLVDAKSVLAGIGPVCAKNNF
jgi:hypothetical protein